MLFSCLALYFVAFVFVIFIVIVVVVAVVIVVVIVVVPGAAGTATATVVFWLSHLLQLTSICLLLLIFTVLPLFYS